jgi:hypothetical protein
MGVLYRRFGRRYRFHLQRSRKEGFLTLEDGPNTLSRNVGKGLFLRRCVIPQQSEDLKTSEVYMKGRPDYSYLRCARASTCVSQWVWTVPRTWAQAVRSTGALSLIERLGTETILQRKAHQDTLQFRYLKPPNDESMHSESQSITANVNERKYCGRTLTF